MCQCPLRSAVNQLGSVQLLSCVRLFATPWTTASQASLSVTNSQSLLRLMFTESVMPSNHLILINYMCRYILFPVGLPSATPTRPTKSSQSIELSSRCHMAASH